MTGGALASGDSVTLKDMPEASGLSGASGTLVKLVGKDRWVVDIEGQEKTRIVTAANLEHSGGEPAKSFRVYSIVGTWDDWEPHEMAFSAKDNCYSYEVRLGLDDVESFKLLLDADWDRCVYPDRGNATPNDGHEVKGPDDGGLDTEWTISKHQEDKKAARYSVRLYVAPDGHPMHVDWQPLDRNEEPQQEAQQDAAQSRQRTRQGRFGQMAASREAERASSPVVPAATPSTRSRSAAAPTTRSRTARSAFTKASSALMMDKPSRQDVVLGHMSRMADSQPGVREQLEGIMDSFGGPARARSSQEELDSRLRSSSPDDDPDPPTVWQLALAGSDVEEVERQARLRLEKRLKEAAEAELLSIEDKRERAGEEEAYEEWMAIKANNFKNLSGWKARAQEQQDRDEKTRARSLGRSTPCVECGQPAVTCIKRDWVCKECHQSFVQAQEAGWDGRLECGDGYFAAEWCMWIAKQRKMLPREARFEVMQKFPTLFKSRVAPMTSDEKAKQAKQAHAKGWHLQGQQKSELVGEE